MKFFYDLILNQKFIYTFVFQNIIAMKCNLTPTLFLFVFGFLFHTSLSAQIVAQDDIFLFGQINDTSLKSVLTNDTLNGNTVLPSSITLQPAETFVYVPIHIDVTTGFVTIDADLAPGTYCLPYFICENANPNNCSSANLCVTVTTTTILALDENINVFGSNCFGISVLANDTLNGLPILPSETTLFSVANNTITINADGTIAVATGTPSGTYCVPYTICENANPNNCSSANLCVTVTTTTILALDENINVFGSNCFGISVLANDTLNGLPILPSETTLFSVANNTITINADGTIAVATGTPSGTYCVPYTICENANPNNCSSANLCVTVTLTSLFVTNDVFEVAQNNISGEIGNVLTNDFMNSAQATTSNVSITPSMVFSPVSLNTQTGAVSIAPNTPLGSYCLPYTLCENSNPNNCQVGSVCINVVSALATQTRTFENLKVYPNPISAGFITISNAQNIEHLTLISALGQIVFDKNIAELTTQIDMNKFSVGLYFLKIKNKNVEQVLKIIKN